MKMQPAHTLREPQIPPPHDPAIAGRPRTPESQIRTLAALRSLVWLTLYVTIMRLLGYRIARDPTPRPARPAPTQAQPPIPPHLTHANPRRKHRYLDRAMCLNLLSSINQDFTPASPAPAQPAAPTPAPAAPHPRAASPPRYPHPAPPPPRTPAIIPPARLARAPPHPPDFQKPPVLPPSKHAHFVTMP